MQLAVRYRLGYSGAMQDFQLYQQILGLVEPWHVKAVTLRREQGEVEIEVECREHAWGCLECGQRMHVHAWERRRWRHLDSCQFKTMIAAEVLRVSCAEHGTQTVAVPWAEKFGRFTGLMERLALALRHPPVGGGGVRSRGGDPDQPRCGVAPAGGLPPARGRGAKQPAHGRAGFALGRGARARGMAQWPRLRPRWLAHDEHAGGRDRSSARDEDEPAGGLERVEPGGCHAASQDG